MAARSEVNRPAEVVQAGERRLARVESLRALAALSVATAHAWGFSQAYGPETRETYIGRALFGGGFFVFLFFALSGYLLFWPFVRHYFGGGAPIDLKRYALNRVVRILPLYWFAVVVLLLLQEEGGSWSQWWHFMLLFENFSREHTGTVDGALWSVVVELHFYLLLPFLAAGIAFVARGRRGLAALVLVALGVVSYWIKHRYELPGGRPDPLVFHNLHGSFVYFVPGMLLALARLELQERRPAWLAGPLGHSGLWLVGSVAAWLVLFDDYARDWLPLIASFLAVGAAVLPLRDSALLRGLDWRPIAAVGVVSYSLYVWHSRVIEHVAGIDGFPDSTAAIMLITLPLSVAVAFVSYRLVEAPFLRLRRRWSTASAPIEGSTRPPS